MKGIKTFFIFVLLSLSVGFIWVDSGHCGDKRITVPHFPTSDIYVRPTILLVGTFYSPDEDLKGNVITILIRDKKWLFKINEARNMTGTELGYSIVNNLFPPRLRLVGADELIQPLLKQDIVGELYSLMGTIYISDNLLHLSAEKKGRLFEDDG